MAVPQGRRNDFDLMVGGGRVNALEGRWGFNTVKTLKCEKGGGCLTPPPGLMVTQPLHFVSFCIYL